MAKPSSHGKTKKTRQSKNHGYTKKPRQNKKVTVILKIHGKIKKPRQNKKKHRGIKKCQGKTKKVAAKLK